MLLCALGCFSSSADKIVDDFTTQVFEWNNANDHWQLLMENGKMDIEPTTSMNIGMKFLVGGNAARDRWASPAAIITDLPGGIPSSFKFGVTFSFRKRENNISETGFVFNYIDEENYSVIALSGKNLVYSQRVNGKWNKISKQKVKWAKIKKNEDQTWELSYEDKTLTFWNKGFPEFKVRNITLENSTIGIFVNKFQQLTVKSVEFEEY